MKKIIHFLLTILSFINICLLYSLRPIWFFVNQEINGDPIWTRLIFLVLIVVFLTNLILLFKLKEFKFKHLLLGILSIVFLGLNIFLISQLGSEKHIVIRNVLQLIPVFVFTALLLLLVQTKYKLSALPKVIMALVMVAIFIAPQLDWQPIRITSGPNFTYVDDQLVVMWTTNVKSTGFVEVGEEGDFERVVTSEHGIIDGNTTQFKVVLPNIEDGDLIRVGSKKIKSYYQNNVVYGKTAYSEYIAYEDTRRKSEIGFYVLSDIHERKEIYGKYLDKEDYDFVIYNGDIISSIDSEELIVSEFFEPITTNTKVKPFYFTRGNHETRGADSRLLDEYLALKDNKYYYTFTYGPVFFIVLDSGEDKADDHIEYGGLADYESYRQEETDWLKSVVEAKDYADYEYIIAISHIPLLEDVEFPYKKEWMDLLSEMSADVLLSGHTHKAELIKTESVPIVIGGGYADSKGGYEGIKVSVDGEGLTIDIVTEDGDIRNTYMIY